MENLETNTREIFNVFDLTNSFLLSQLTTLNKTLGDHFKILGEMSNCMKVIDAETQQLKELRNFVRRESTTQDQMIPRIFQQYHLLEQS